MSNSSDSKFVDVLDQINEGLVNAANLQNSNGSNANYNPGPLYNFTAQNQQANTAGSNALMLAVGGIAVIGGAAYLTKKYVK